MAMRKIDVERRPLSRQTSKNHERFKEFCRASEECVPLCKWRSATASTSFPVGASEEHGKIALEVFL